MTEARYRAEEEVRALIRDRRNLSAGLPDAWPPVATGTLAPLVVIGSPVNPLAIS